MFWIYHIESLDAIAKRTPVDLREIFQIFTFSNYFLSHKYQIKNSKSTEQKMRRPSYRSYLEEDEKVGRNFVGH